MKKLSPDYVSTLNPHNRQSYEKKVSLCFNIDPYELSFEDCDNDWDIFPRISHGNIYHYFVYSTNSLNNVQMNAFKSLESHNYFTSGWVNPLIHHKALPEMKHLLLGEVCLFHVYL